MVGPGVVLELIICQQVVGVNKPADSERANPYHDFDMLEMESKIVNHFVFTDFLVSKNSC
jgi:hypothetical protein